MININTKEYWESRFSSGDWEVRKGRTQTADFARSQIPNLGLPDKFSGVILDFGCGLGDAMPLYHRAFPEAKLVGVDVSDSAIAKCRQFYGDIAEFKVGTHLSVPEVDVIVASNVFEHLSSDHDIARSLLEKCHTLLVTVPYKENPLCSEHIRNYDESYFQAFAGVECVIFFSRGWSEFGRHLLKLRVGNALRKILSKPAQSRRSQIMFRIPGLLRNSPNRAY